MSVKWHSFFVRILLKMRKNCKRFCWEETKSEVLSDIYSKEVEIMIDIEKRIEEVKKRLEQEERAKRACRENHEGGKEGDILWDELDMETEMAYQRMLKEEQQKKRKKSFIDWEKRIFVDNKGRVYTFDELYEKYLENESFEGKVANIKNIERYNELERCAFELKELCGDVTNVVTSPPDKRSPWACIHIDFVWMLYLGDKETIGLIEKMMALCDSFSINGSSFSTVRLSFGINGVWEK